MKKNLIILVSVLLLGLTYLSGDSLVHAEKVTPRRDLVDFNGARDIAPTWRTELTDGSPTATVITTTDLINNVVVDVLTDKGGTLTIIPLLDSDNLAVEGKPSDTLVIPAGGATVREGYTMIAAPNTKIIFTKTEVGTTTGFLLFVKGTAR